MVERVAQNPKHSEPVKNAFFFKDGYTWRRPYEDRGDRVAGGSEFGVVFSFLQCSLLSSSVLIVGVEWRDSESLHKPSRHLSTVEQGQ